MSSGKCYAMPVWRSNRHLQSYFPFTVQLPKPLMNCQLWVTRVCDVAGMVLNIRWNFFVFSMMHHLAYPYLVTSNCSVYIFFRVLFFFFVTFAF